MSILWQALLEKKAVIWIASAVFRIPQLQMLCCQQWHRREACLLADTLVGGGGCRIQFLNLLGQRQAAFGYTC